MKRLLIFVLGMILMVNTAFVSPSVLAVDPSEAVITNLTVDYAKNPLGLDNKAPLFGWNMQSAQRGQRQTAYELWVATDKTLIAEGRPDVWNSGRVEASASVGIVYGGTPLLPCTEYFWQVRVFDREGRLATSEIAFFETGLMDSGWGDAEFIGRDESAAFGDTQFTVEMDLTIHSGAASIGFGGVSKSNFYMWQINAYNNTNLYLRPHKITNGSYSVIKEIDLTPHLGYTSAEALGKELHIMLQVNNGTVSTYFGDSTTPVSTIELGQQVTLGRLIFRGYASAKVTEKTTYDNIVIKNSAGAVIFSEDFEGEECTSFNTNTTSLVLADGGYTVGTPSSTGMEYWGIMTDAAFATGEAAPMLRKEFTLGEGIASARIYATAAGAYNLYLNGKRVGEEYLAPGRTEYSEYLLYQTYDVTNMLCEGENALGGLLGHGWYNRARGNYGDNLALLLRLVVRYEDGREQVIVTDGSWRFSLQGPLLDDDIYNGDKYDARRELDGWATAAFTPDSTWRGAVTYTKDSLNLGDIISLPAEGIKIVDTLTAVAVTEPQDGVFIYDFGQNTAGIVEFTATAPAGTVIKLRHGEVLNVKLNDEGTGMDGEEGTLYTENLYTNNKQMKAEATDYYTFKGDENGETYSPLMTQHGFRYVEITGLEEALPLDAVKALVMSSAMEDTGEFTTSDEMVNRLYKNALWSKLSNFISVPIDCPQRSERMGWTGDAQIFCRTATYMSDCNNFYKKYLKDVFSTQLENGAIMDATPNGFYNATGNAANGWGDSAIIIPWQLYTQYGDTSVIIEYFDKMCFYVDHLVATSDNYIRNNGPYGDWMNCGQDTPTEIVDTAYSAYSCRLLSKMAAAIGRNEEAEIYANHFEGYKSAWRKAFIGADGRITDETQTAYVLGIQFDLFNTDELPAAAERLVALIKANGNKISGGFLGLPFINPALSKVDCDSTAYTLLLQDAYPSWLWPITMQASTIWEAFYVQNPWTGMVALSHNHYAYGSIAEWMYTDMLGIKRDETSPDTVAYKNIILDPATDGDIEFVKGGYRSAMGQISVAWSKGENQFNYSVTVPANTTATLYLPVEAGQTVYEGALPAADSKGVELLGSESGKNCYRLASGSYNFTVCSPSATLSKRLLGALRFSGTAIRTEGVQGMRFKTVISSAIIEKGIDGYYLDEYGTLAIKTEELSGGELTLNGKYSFNGGTVVPRKGVAYKKGIKDLYFERDFAETAFTAVLIGITEQNYKTDYTTRCYFVFKNTAGQELTVYADPNTSDVYSVAERAYNAKETTGVFSEAPETRRYLNQNILNGLPD